MSLSWQFMTLRITTEFNIISFVQTCAIKTLLYSQYPFFFLLHHFTYFILL